MNIVRQYFRNSLQSSQLLKSDKYVIQPVAGIRSVPGKADSESKKEVELAFNPELRHRYPDFLPHPWLPWRNAIREKLERADMLKRRAHLNIPEFYVGTIMAVTSSTPHAPQKTTRFLGICIFREGTGLNSRFMLRNIIDNIGVEFNYELYDPKIQRIEVLRLEKRLDPHLLYLRDAEPQYSTFPFDMEPEFIPEGEPVPVNPIMVKLKPEPWRTRHEIKDYKGVLPFKVTDRRRIARAIKSARAPKNPVEGDLMWQYRNTIPEEEQREIFAEVCSELQKGEIKRKTVKRRIEFMPPTKTA